ncbi:LacI family DNA-binding transcriptional regulator [Radiobacillus sp. PE A8.2]|uniref:LacI family DNA-binding transcriptional regulator n=1 Tax=Radiobacillus sp. PE A8.2 TaxID=3380349 RepID=UPI0038904FFD
MVRIIDVAQKANVSTATVSRVLANSSIVKEETKKKVLKAIKELNYQPNVLARQLRTLEAKTIIVVVPDISNPFFSNVLRGIESVAKEKEYLVLLVDADNDVEQESKCLNILRQKKADGMILLTAKMDANMLERMAEEYPIVVACEYFEGSNIPTVSVDNISGARKATEFLINHGHKRIGTISGPLDSVLGQDRLKGFCQAMTIYNLSVDPILIQKGDFSYESGLKLTKDLLALNQPPTGIFAANDEMAFGAINSIKSIGLNVPNDISVVGFDDIKFSSIFEPSLTTISQPAFEIGINAMTTLLNIINNKDLKERQMVLSGKLRVRNSCAVL